MAPPVQEEEGRVCDEVPGSISSPTSGGLEEGCVIGSHLDLEERREVV